MTTQRSTLQYRLDVLSRIVAAVFGGYALATFVSALVPRLFGLSRPEAVMSGLLMSFVVYAAAILGCFASRSAGRAWLWLGAAVLLTGTCFLIVGPG